MHYELSVSAFYCKQIDIGIISIIKILGDPAAPENIKISASNNMKFYLGKRGLTRNNFVYNITVCSNIYFLFVNFQYKKKPNFTDLK